jgi:hypothetical protein
LAAGAALPVAAAAALNVAQFGTPAGGYREESILGGPFWTGLAGLLLSPSRGLLFFAPWLFLGAATLARPSSPWHRACGAAALPILLLHAAFPHWWAGWSYGPRYLTDAAPFLAVLAAPALVDLWRARAARPAGPALAVALVAASIGAQAVGAFCFRSDVWNEKPLDVDEHPERCFELSGSQVPVTLAAGLAPRGFPGHEASFYVAVDRVRRGDLDEAEVYARRGLEVNPGSQGCRAVLAEISRRRR